jgi:putative addiction module component (TIGR02574 family)
MNLKQIENQALDLPEEERAQLAQRLILSLESSNDEGLEKEWLLEAKRRAVEIDKGEVQPVPAEEVRKKAQALLR